MKPISICIPTYERYLLLLESFSKVIKDERVGEIIIVDDCSSEENYNDVRNAVKWLPKVNLFRNESNKDCYLNKREAISRAANEYVIILDSDNIIGVDYLDKIYEHEWAADTILAPSFARPTFDYRAFGGLTIDRQNVSEYMPRKMFSTALNTMNFFINKNEYLRCFDATVDPVTADSIYFNFCWLNAGNKIKFVQGLEYDHLVHKSSHYILNNSRTERGFYERIENKLLSMK